MKEELLGKIRDHEAVVGVVGMGYVGLPLLLEFSRAGFPVLGFDVDEAKVESIRAGKSYIAHIPDEGLQEVFDGVRTADATTDFGRVGECDAILICVPTPLSQHRTPDLSYVRATAQALSPQLRRGQLVTLESTTYPGTTAEVLVPELEAQSGMKACEDFLVAYSPEREDPNNAQYGTSTIPKVVGGIDADSLEVACALYDSVICETVRVSSCATAEATKLMENIFRSVNIALVNELKVVFTKMGIDVWEVIRAASTKPFGFMPFYPGPGLGGYCIPIDPFYLTWKAKEYEGLTKFIELAGEINTAMPEYVVHRTLLALNKAGKAVNGSRVLLVGVAYKKNVDDDRESPAYSLWEKLEGLGASVDYYDPYCPVIGEPREHPGLSGRECVVWDDISKNGYDAAVIATAHDNVDHQAIASMVELVVDARGVCEDGDNIFRA